MNYTPFLRSIVTSAAALVLYATPAKAQETDAQEQTQEQQTQQCSDGVSRKYCTLEEYLLSDEAKTWMGEGVTFIEMKSDPTHTFQTNSPQIPLLSNLDDAEIKQVMTTYLRSISHIAFDPDAIVVKRTEKGVETYLTHTGYEQPFTQKCIREENKTALVARLRWDSQKNCALIVPLSQDEILIPESYFGDISYLLQPTAQEENSERIPVDDLSPEEFPTKIPKDVPAPEGITPVTEVPAAETAVAPEQPNESPSSAGWTTGAQYQQGFHLRNGSRAGNSYGVSGTVLYQFQNKTLIGLGFSGRTGSYDLETIHEKTTEPNPNDPDGTRGETKRTRERSIATYTPSLVVGGQASEHLLLYGTLGVEIEARTDTIRVTERLLDQRGTELKMSNNARIDESTAFFPVLEAGLEVMLDDGWNFTTRIGLRTDASQTADPLISLGVSKKW